ncbi:hypothetical protein JCM19231_5671 [Vibrio ishigakensis]|uniref:Uncharacterized protein n=1 Tax=Vibrio ishigakensis TaxID=1481914 RepID=A0A0B8NZ74_9VIBR|nr:hypothetical protein JCM19231_5671 [Vibrio ishigakensis]
MRTSPAELFVTPLDCAPDCVHKLLLVGRTQCIVSDQTQVGTG